MGEKADFKLSFPLFVLAREPRKRHPVSDVTVIDSETTFAIIDIWGDLYLQAFTDHRRVAEFLKSDDNKDCFYAVLYTQPAILKMLVTMLRDFQSLKVGIIFDPHTPELHRRITHSDLLRLM